MVVLGGGRAAQVGGMRATRCRICRQWNRAVWASPSTARRVFIPCALRSVSVLSLFCGRCVCEALKWRSAFGRVDQLEPFAHGEDRREHRNAIRDKEGQPHLERRQGVDLAGDQFVAAIDHG